MKQTTTPIEITNALYVDLRGELRFQNPITTHDRSLSHIARMRSNMIEMTTLMCLLTGMDETQMSELVAGLALEWLLAYTQADEQDVYLLMDRKDITGWWRKYWFERDEQMSGLITHEYGKLLRRYHQNELPPEECRRRVNMEMMKRYIKLHQMCMDSKTYHYRHLEDSYAKLW